MSLRLRLVLRLAAAALALCLGPAAAYAQTGAIAGQVRDAQNSVLPGVLVEVTSPALIEKVRSATTDESGRYQIQALPIGTYEVSFSLNGFSTLKRQNVVVTTEATANVPADMQIGNITQDVIVAAEAPVVDVANARQQIVFQGADIRDLPTDRNIGSLLNLVPGLVTTRGAPGLQAGGESCAGGIGIFCSPNLNGFNSHASQNDAAGLSQGRIMVDGIVINAARGGITGMNGGYIADVGNAQEVTFTLSGALGESETGGAAINIIPRTGGNRNAGNFLTSYTSTRLFDKNNGDFDYLTQIVPIKYDYDVGGAFSGPIMRDRLWYYAAARDQGKEQVPSPGQPFFWNKNLGVPGMNYQPDRSRGELTYRNRYRNVSARLTLQATQKNKFNIFWDEQDSCQDPCYGVVSVYTSPESWWSVTTKPNHLGQVTWNNPVTSRLLLEGRFSAIMQHYDLTRHREIANPRGIPRITETGNTAGYDEVATRVNAIAGGACPFGCLTSGSLNNSGSELRNNDTYRSQASVSYITGSHNAKFGYEGGYYVERQTNNPNDLRLTLNFATPATNCADTLTCGNTSLYFPGDPNNTIARRPVPTSFELNTGLITNDERVWYGALYLQDQWTVNRFTLSGALRYDHAESRYGETCVSGSEPYVPVQQGGAFDGQRGWCTTPSNGVNYNDLTPRFGAAWDVFGNGKTSVKVNMGKYLSQASLGGLYTDANPARRSSNTLTRGWQDTNGNRVPDCRYFDFTAHTDLGDTCNAIGQTVGSASRRYGRDPYALDSSGDNAAFFATQYCGRTGNASPIVQAYCEQTGNNLLSGWGSRGYEWQLGLGVQHEILPRVSAEVTYNRRIYGNQQQTDVLGRGCDRFDGGQSYAAARNEVGCQDDYLNFVSPHSDFYSFAAPVDPRLPGGGGYRVIGNIDAKGVGEVLPNQGTVVAFDPDLNYSWSGVDTNFVLRARGGLRVSGGTSTGRAARNTCYSTLDEPNVRQRDNGHGAACSVFRPLQTSARGNASYTIPWADVLVATVWTFRPGPERSANLQLNSSDIVWNAASAQRATAPCTVNGVASVGCFYGATTASNTRTVNLLDTGDLYGGSVSLFDLKFSKNVRFAGKRLNVGVDVYNLLNTDTITDYNNTYTAWRDANGVWQQGDNPNTAQVEVQNWGRAVNLTSPRYMRFTVNLDF